MKIKIKIHTLQTIIQTLRLHPPNFPIYPSIPRPNSCDLVASRETKLAPFQLIHFDPYSESFFLAFVICTLVRINDQYLRIYFQFDATCKYFLAILSQLNRSLEGKESFVYLQVCVSSMMQLCEIHVLRNG